jgi:NAD(P)-dependent dehydrogenase (short-subunit alcohol dehydrogenase family)
MKDLQGCVAVVTGGAAGIGAAVSRGLAEAGCTAGVGSMTQSLARAVAPAIRVVSVSPGLADTELVKGMDASWREQQAARTPLKRLALPQEVARAVVAAASHLAFTTDAVIPIDGGRPLA